MRFVETKIHGVFLVEADSRVDDRGLFAEAFNTKDFTVAGAPFSVSQMNVSMSNRKGTVRGMHWQAHPFGQGKLVSCLKGRVWDVVIDIRKGSPTLGTYIDVELIPDNRCAILVPKDCAHGWQALEDKSEILYLVDGLWKRDHERGLRPDDPAIGVVWPIPPAFMAERDTMWPLY